MRTCRHCGGEITNKFLDDCCIACLERAMDSLTPEDIESAMRDLVERSEHIAIVRPDGTRERVDPSAFWNYEQKKG